MNPKQRLRQLAPCVTTGIGGAPSAEFGWRCDVPYLVELVSRGETLASVDLPSTWPAFVEAVAHRKPPFVKVQVPGPRSSGRELTARALLFVARLLELGVTPMVFIDEPMLVTGGDWAALRALRDSIRDAGAIVGLHCCGNAEWGRVLGLDFDVISFDARLSLEAVVEDQRAWRTWLESDGWLALGVIPTNPGARYDVRELCESVEATLSSISSFPEILRRVMLTPACGLGLHSNEDADRIVRDLVQAQAHLRALPVAQD